MIPMKVSEGGRVVIPVEIRRQLGLKDGDTVLWDVKDGEVHLTTRAANIKKAQELVRKYVRPGVSIVDELIAERRAEADRE